MKKRIALVGLLALASAGCSNTVRHLTATHWQSTPGEAPKRVFYITYWEGSCSAGALGFGRGCSKGDSRVKRCDVQADNSLVCVDESVLNQALSTSN